MQTIRVFVKEMDHSSHRVRDGIHCRIYDHLEDHFQIQVFVQVATNLSNRPNFLQSSHVTFMKGCPMNGISSDVGNHPGPV